jgi:hypothetical protein
MKDNKVDKSGDDDKSPKVSKGIFIYLFFLVFFKISWLENW